MNRNYIILITWILLALFSLGCLTQLPWSDPMQPEPKPKPNPMNQAWEEEQQREWEEEQMRREWEEEQMRREWEEEQMRREWEEEQQRQWEEEQMRREWEEDIRILSVNTGDLESDDDYNLNSEYVIIWNTGDRDVVMSGWKLYDKSYKRGRADHVFYFPFGFVLGAGEFVFIYSGKGLSSFEYTDSGIIIHKLYWGRRENEGAQIWMDLSDCAYLEDERDNLVHEYCW